MKPVIPRMRIDLSLIDIENFANKSGAEIMVSKLFKNQFQNCSEGAILMYFS